MCDSLYPKWPNSKWTETEIVQPLQPKRTEIGNYLLAPWMGALSWLAFARKISTMDDLRTKGFIVDNISYMCSQCRNKGSR